MRRPLMLSMLLLAGAAVWAAPKATVKVPGAADELIVILQRSKGPSYRVSLDKGNVVYEASESEKSTPVKTTFTPTSQEWSKFNLLVEESGMWDWKANYGDPHNDRGLQWGVRLRRGHRSREIRGHNVYPDAARFRMFESAVKVLIKGNAFE